MKALSLLQPYGSLMFVPDGKRFETRSWRTKHRGLIAIHASKKLDNWHHGFAKKHRAILWPNGVDEPWIRTGAIIGVLDIVEMFTTNEAIDAGLIDRPSEREFGDYGPNRYAWATANPIKLTFPIPCNGALQLWTVPDHIERQIIEQIGDKIKAGDVKLGRPDWLTNVEPNPDLMARVETVKEYIQNRLHGEWVKPNDDQS